MCYVLASPRGLDLPMCYLFEQLPSCYTEAIHAKPGFLCRCFSLIHRSGKTFAFRCLQEAWHTQHMHQDNLNFKWQKASSNGLKVKDNTYIGSQDSESPTVAQAPDRQGFASFLRRALSSWWEKWPLATATSLPRCGPQSKRKRFRFSSVSHIGELSGTLDCITLLSSRRMEYWDSPKRSA